MRKAKVLFVFFYISICFSSRFDFSRDEIQAFREEHEQRNGELSKPDEESSSTNTHQSSLKRPIDLRWSVNLKDSSLANKNGQKLNNLTPIDVLRQTRNAANENFQPFAYRFDRLMKLLFVDFFCYFILKIILST